MNKRLKKELKRVLSGRTIMDNNGVLMALPEGHRMLFQGVLSGWGSVQFWGVAVQEYCFKLADDGGEAYEIVLAAMQALGRMVYLEQRDTALCCIRRYAMSRPVVLAAIHEGDGLVRLSLYTGKGAVAKMIQRRALQDFCRALPEGLANPVPVAVKSQIEVQTEQAAERKKTRKERKAEKALQALYAEQAKQAEQVKGKREM